MTDAPAVDDRSIRIVHLLPDLLSVYGDTGNIRALVVRARRRGIRVSITQLLADDPGLPRGDLYVIGGGQDRDQVAVEGVLGRLGDELGRAVADGAAILAVCGGYQSLGTEYRTAEGRVLRGPGVLDVRTVGSGERLVGPVVARLTDTRFGPGRLTLVGFENHSGRSELGSDAAPLATVERGGGNNGRDATEGLLAVPGMGGMRGLRIGTYLHGPVLPRNPHLADGLLAAALSNRGQTTDLEPLDDTVEWRAHDRFVERWRTGDWSDRLPRGLRKVVEPVRRLVGP